MRSKQIKHSNDHIKGNQVRRGGESTLVPPLWGKHRLWQVLYSNRHCSGRQWTYHNGEHNTDLVHHLKDAQQDQEQDLEQRVAMDPAIGNVSQELVIWFVLVRHKREEETLNKLWRRGSMSVIFGNLSAYLPRIS